MYREFAVMGALARYVECVWELAPVVIVLGEGTWAYGPAARAERRRRHAAGLAPNCAAERRIGLIADVLGNARQRRIAAAEEIRGEQHTPLRQVLHRRDADQVMESLREYRPRGARVVRQLLQRPGLTRTRMQNGQCGADDAIAHPGQPSGSTFTLLVHVQAQDLDEQHLGEFGQDAGAAGP